MDQNRKKGLSIILVFLLLIMAFPAYTFVKKQLDKKNSAVVVDPNIQQNSDSKGHYAISTGSEYASMVGKEILESGGNAVDAAIATSFALGVSMPQNGSLGGGGVMLVYNPKTEEAYYYDYYNAQGFEESHHNIGVPGFLKGMEAIHSDYASMDLASLIDPAIELAEEGILVDGDMAEILQRRIQVIEFNPNLQVDGSPLKEGDVLIQKDLAETYREVRDHGFDLLYEGKHPISQNYMKISGLSEKSMAAYEVHKYPAIKLEEDGYTFYAAGSPFSGRLTLSLMRAYQLKNLSILDSDDETLYKGYRDIYNSIFLKGNARLGDTDVSRKRDHREVEWDKIAEYLDVPVDLEEYPIDVEESQNTTSFSIIDKDGMVVVASHTLSNYWGSHRYADGFFYNNSLKNFGRYKQNRGGPMHRPKSFMSPLVVFDESKENMIALGSAGGNTIPQVLSSFLAMNLYEGQDWETIVNTQRYTIGYDIFSIEKGLREHELFSSPPANEKYFYAEVPADKLGYISLATIENGEYRAYHETTLCDEKCSLAQ